MEEICELWMEISGNQTFPNVANVIFSSWMRKNMYHGGESFPL
jgi:hypothetical protein